MKLTATILLKFQTFRKTSQKIEITENAVTENPQKLIYQSNTRN